ncbi:uncharacterized protein SAPINGB_P003231 [Magnusiomyces paraingens]|uniref:Crossover junction endonuclease MUS81 n=1 Tax=Magnusiomyces paraingens TaxID=2606893 RepID=A0A5E8BLT0_9ASCO|nr:uncharacterized protein SAPINGB_P003231 [Saprochaete ingens]VVT51842.1 unnamed protein product [Saprochaete ingens]
MVGPPASWNPLFVEWLQEIYEEAVASNKTSRPIIYKRAQTSLMQCPKQFDHPSKLVELRFFGPAICQKLEKKMQKYCNAKSIPMPESDSSSASAPQRSRSQHSSTGSIDIYYDSSNQQSQRARNSSSAARSRTLPDIPAPTLSASNPYRTTATSTPDFTTGGIGRSRAATTSQRKRKTPANSIVDPPRSTLSASNPYKTTTASTPDLAVSGIGSRRPVASQSRKSNTTTTSTIPISIDIEDDAAASSESQQTDSRQSKRQKSTRTYIPRPGSGGYAILITLFHNAEINGKSNGMSRDEITSIAHHLSNESFQSDFHAGRRYSAWNSIKKLIEKGLVYKNAVRNPKFFITDEGMLLADKILQAEKAAKKDTPLTTSAPGSFSNSYSAFSRPQSASASQTVGDFIDIDISDDDFEEIIRPPSTLASFSATTPNKNHTIELNSKETPKNNSNGLQDAWRLEKSKLTPNSQVRAELRRLTQLTGIQGNSISTANTITSLPVLPESSPIKQNIEDCEMVRQIEEIGADGRYDRVIWGSNDYRIGLLIDNREVRSVEDRNYFINKLEEQGVLVEERALAVSDVVWIARHKRTGKVAVLDFILERKRLDDLLSSIRDGRFSEQKHRLKKTGISNITYLIEEYNINERTATISQTIATAMSQAITVDDFFLKRTASSESTVTFLAMMTKRIEHEYRGTDLYFIIPRISTPSSYRYAILRARMKIDSRKKNGQINSSMCNEPMGEGNLCLGVDFEVFQTALSKSGMVTVKELYIRMLQVIKGVTLEKAKMIQNSYPTPRSLVDAYDKEATEEDKKNMIFRKFGSNITKLRIRKELSEKIYLQWGCLS